MAKPTLLELVQEVLVEIDGDEVNSISDTEESEMVAQMVKTVYSNMMSNTTWPHTRRAVGVTSRSDNSYPTHMTLDSNVKELVSVRYNKIKNGETRKNYVLLQYLEPDHFLNKINKRDNTKSNIDVIIDDSGIELLIQNDKAPEYYTSFDEVNMIFDSYDSDVDSVLQTSKLQVQAYIIPAFTLSDSFVADLPVDAFSMLREEVISRAQLKLRQFEDIKSEQESQRQSRWMSRKNWAVSGGIKYPNYGRVRNLAPHSSLHKLPKDNL